MCVCVRLPSQIFHVGPLINLQTLNLSHNFLTRISAGGLAACVRLNSLDLSKNLLADHANVRYLAYLPGLCALKIAGNPIAEEKNLRCACVRVSVCVCVARVRCVCVRAC